MLEKMIKERVRLEAELKKGRQMLVELQRKANGITANMQRIQGAMQFIDSQVAEAGKQEPLCENVGNPTLETKDEPERT